MATTPPAAPQLSGTSRNAPAAQGAPTLRALAIYLLLGTLFGIVLIKSEVVSWFRIQEMFHFQAFHMYGIIGSAVITAALSLQLIRWLRVRSLSGEPITIPPKVMGRGTRYWLGGTIFGLWVRVRDPSSRSSGAARW